MKRIRAAFLLGLMVIMLGDGLTAADRPVIAVIKSRDTVPYNTALDGFRKALRELSVSATLIQYDLKGDRETGTAKIREIKALKPSVVLTIGTMATEIAKENFTETPVLFCMVLNPVDDGLVASLKSSENNVTGACLDIPCRKQFKIMKNAMPNLKTIGVLYNKQETGSMIDEAVIAAESLHLSIIPREVHSESDVPRALEELATKVDCLWAVSDSTVFSSIKSIQFTILFTLQNNIPFMGLSSAFVKSGALLAISSDIEDNGFQAGEIASRLLEGYAPSEIPIATPRKTFISLNLRTAEQIGVSLSSDVVATAKEIFK